MIVLYKLPMQDPSWGALLDVSESFDQPRSPRQG